MHLRWPLAAAASFGLGLAASCGADRQVAPEQPAPMVQCRSFDELMPRFVGAISTGKTEGLKNVVENQLLKTTREDTPPPINDVLRVIFATLNRLASKPPEPGGTKENSCAPAGAPPPLERANEVCELRRTIDLLVRQGKGLDAIGVVEPQLQGILDYVTGTGTSRDRVPHYEVAAAFSNLCSNSMVCQLSNGLDLIIEFTAYANTPDGRRLVQNLNTLGTKQTLTAFLAPQNLSEDGFIAIARALIPAIKGADPTALENAFNQLTILPADLRADLRPLIEDLKVLLRNERLRGSISRALTCIETGDRNYDIVRMLYRLAIRDMRPEFGITRLSQIFKQLQDVDQRGSLIFLANTLAQAVRNDEDAINAAASTCKTLLATSPNNAQQALPVVADLVRNGLVQEALCAVDTLLFGCSGGAQPACR
ncbi:MAG: hypothetical protein SFW67_22890 [Myxococcaceae bacterium]|nr:hypothetical protein [Myxococcaceae bacterium]